MANLYLETKSLEDNLHNFVTKRETRQTKSKTIPGSKKLQKEKKKANIKVGDEFIANFRKWKTQTGLQIPEIAKGSRVSNVQILKLENGEKLVPYDTLFKLLVYVGQKKEYYRNGNYWFSTDDPTMDHAIMKLSQTLSSLVSIIKTDNHLGLPGSTINEFQKRQIIALLEVALTELKAPKASSGSLRNLLDSLRRIGKKSAEREVGEKISDAIDAAENGLSDILTKSETVDTISSIPSIF